MGTNEISDICLYFWRYKFLFIFYWDCQRESFSAYEVWNYKSYFFSSTKKKCLEPPKDDCVQFEVETNTTDKKSKETEIKLGL